MAKNWSKSKGFGHSQGVSYSQGYTQVNQWSGGEDHWSLGLDRGPREYLKPSLEFLESTLMLLMNEDGELTRDDLKWYRLRVEKIFGKFLRGR